MRLVEQEHEEEEGGEVNGGGEEREEEGEEQEEPTTAATPPQVDNPRPELPDLICLIRYRCCILALRYCVSCVAVM